MEEGRGAREQAEVGASWPDLTHEVSAPDDLTHELLLDIGWFPDSDLDGVANDSDREANSDLKSP